jgi:hypothetical protein
MRVRLDRLERLRAAKPQQQDGQSAAALDPQTANAYFCQAERCCELLRKRNAPKHFGGPLDAAEVKSWRGFCKCLQ